MKQPSPAIQAKIADRAKEKEILRYLHNAQGGVEVNMMLQLLTLMLDEAKNKFLTITPDEFAAMQERANVLQGLISDIRNGPRGTKETA